MKNAKLLFAVLFILTTQLFTSCTQDHDFTATSSNEILTRSQWSVDSYQAQGQTMTFGNYRILFNEGGSLNVKKDGQLISGSWNKSINSSNQEVIHINLHTTDANLMELNKSWKIVAMNSTSVSFEINDATTPCQLRIKKEY